MEILVVVGIVLVLVAAYFLFIRKSAPELPAAEEEKKLPAKAKDAKPAKAEPKKAEPKKAEPKKEAPAAKEEAEPAAEAAEVAVEEAPEPPEPSRKPAPPAPPGSRREPAPVSARKADVEGLRRGLGKSRGAEGFFGRLRALFVGKKEIDPEILERMEEVLLSSDVGVKTTEMLLGELKDALEKHELGDSERAWARLRERAGSILAIGGGGIAVAAKPTVVMFVGVNGVGKTTTIGKLATKLKAEGKTVVLAAGDTFRAAAVQQLGVWGKRVGCEVVSGKDGANPGAVIFDAIQRAKDVGADVVLVDTAGRLHTKTNLMEELSKVSRTMAKAMSGAPHETLLVLDATNGQNAMQQAALFKESLPLSGIVLTKLDGTAKGGVILGICAEHKVPVRYIGLGERAEDLRDFAADEFVEALLGQSEESAEAA